MAEPAWAKWEVVSKALDWAQVLVNAMVLVPEEAEE